MTENMTENTEIKTEQKLINPTTYCDNSKDDYKNIINQTNIRSSTIENGFKAALSTGDFGIQLGQPYQVIICSFIGGNNIEDVIFMNKKDEDKTNTRIYISGKSILCEFLIMIFLLLSG